MKRIYFAAFVLISVVFSGCSGVKVVEVPNLQTEEAKQIVEGARAQIGVVTEYTNDYFAADSIPENSGACADVIWRALKTTGFDLRPAIEKDIKKRPNAYPDAPPRDSNVNFRRVKMVRVYFDKFAETLPIEVIPGDVDNLQTWQGGDIVTFAQLPSGLEHIAIVSDKRRLDGVPLIIHNYGKGVLENDLLLSWPSEITGHYRFFDDQSGA